MFDTDTTDQARDLDQGPLTLTDDDDDRDWYELARAVTFATFARKADAS